MIKSLHMTTISQRLVDRLIEAEEDGLDRVEESEKLQERPALAKRPARQRALPIKMIPMST